MVDRALAQGRTGFTRVGADEWAGIHYDGMDVPRWLTGIPVLFLLWPGPQGAETSVRFEALLEGIQETEARIFIEQALHRGRGRWELTGFDRRMSGVFAGGTDMLVRTVRHVLAEPKAVVPVSVGTAWTARSRLGLAKGEVAGLAAVEMAGRGTCRLFVGASGGDRLFRPRARENGMRLTAALTPPPQPPWPFSAPPARPRPRRWPGR